MILLSITSDSNPDKLEPNPKFALRILIAFVLHTIAPIRDGYGVLADGLKTHFILCQSREFIKA